MVSAFVEICLRLAKPERVAADGEGVRIVGCELWAVGDSDISVY